ncbi:MAG: hypothetical protein RIS92_2242 [Verrucomicrobiota bacterium]
MDGEEAVVAVVWTGQEHFEFEIFECADEALVFGFDFCGSREGIWVHGVELDEGVEVGHPLFQRDEGMDFGAEDGDLLNVLLGALFIVPEIGGAHGLFDVCEIFLECW